MGINFVKKKAQKQKVKKVSKKTASKKAHGVYIFIIILTLMKSVEFMLLVSKFIKIVLSKELLNSLDASSISSSRKVTKWAISAKKTEIKHEKDFCI